VSHARRRLVAQRLVFVLAALVTSCRSSLFAGRGPASVDELLRGTANPEALPLEASDPGTSFDPGLRARLRSGV
jgi:hypothetical protein